MQDRLINLTFSPCLSSLFSTSFLFLPGRYGCRLQYRSHTISYRRVGSSIRVRCRRTKAHHVGISLEVVEWSEQLRSVTSVWPGTVRHRVQIRLCTSRCRVRMMFGRTGYSPLLVHFFKLCLTVVCGYSCVVHCQIQ